MENQRSVPGRSAIKAKPKQGKVLRLEASAAGRIAHALAFFFALLEFQPSPFFYGRVDMFLDGSQRGPWSRGVSEIIQDRAVRADLLRKTLLKATTSSRHQRRAVSHVIVRPNISTSASCAGAQDADVKMEESS
jgi:hypothetical protein